MNTALVHGLGVTGVSTARALYARGYQVTISDDSQRDQHQDLANALGLELLPSVEAGAFAATVDLVSPAPGVPESHPVILAAQQASVPIKSELELAYEWEGERAGGRRPMLAITGTDGKTTTTEMTVAIVRAAGLRTQPLGNNETPLIDALDSDLDVFVVECSSFRMRFTQRFRSDAAAWLNLAPDHLNWHDDAASYENAKARIYSQQHADDTAIGYALDPTVMRHLRSAPSRQRTFGAADADYRYHDGWLLGPSGPIVAASQLRRALPHDITNALAASALVLETGLASPDEISAALGEFTAPAHRLELVGERDGVAWYNDSKATTPHAAAVAVAAFDSLVLIAGGSRKGVALDAIADAGRGRIRRVIAIGAATPDVHAAFDPTGIAITDAGSMTEAISIARTAADEGDAVVLSPGCASFDWYQNFEHRGDDFRRLVQQEVLT